MSEETRLVCNQYSEYLKGDMKAGVKAIEESVDETLTRLDEYSSLIDMVRENSSLETCKSILERKDELEIIFDKIRKLEYLVQRIKQDVDKVEELVQNAETDLGISTEGKLRHILRPFFRRANTFPEQRGRNHGHFERPELPQGFTEAERRAFEECAREAFFQRSLPLMVGLGSGTYMAIKNGIFKPHHTYGATPKVLLACTLAYFFGQMSYHQRCAQKLMVIPDSKIGEMLRKQHFGVPIDDYIDSFPNTSCRYLIWIRSGSLSEKKLCHERI